MQPADSGLFNSRTNVWTLPGGCPRRHRPSGSSRVPASFLGAIRPNVSPKKFVNTKIPEAEFILTKFSPSFCARACVRNRKRLLSLKRIELKTVQNYHPRLPGMCSETRQFQTKILFCIRIRAGFFAVRQLICAACTGCKVNLGRHQDPLYARTHSLHTRTLARVHARAHCYFLKVL